MAYKCINNLAPQYLTKITQLRPQPAKTLHTDSDYFFLTPPPIPCHSKTQRSFSHAAPHIWNNLPYKIRTSENISKFKSLLKTYLFKDAFSTN